MNSLKRVLFKSPILLLCVIGTVVYGQKETKTYKEVFNTTPETVLDINTSNTDIEFETWSQDQIEIVATITLEGATKEEAAAYFEREAFDIQGNSKKVRVSTKNANTFFFNNQVSMFDDLHFEHEPLFPSGLEMDSLFLALPSIDSQNLFFDFSMMHEMPPMPPMPKQNFDYQAFKEDGEKYLKKWQKEFSKGFNKEYEKELEEWSKRMEKQAKAMEEKRKEREAQRAERQEKLEKRRAEQNERRLEVREKVAAARERAREQRREARSQNNTRSIWISRGDNDESNIFYFPKDGTNKNYKVKKTLKIKMPKGLKIEMDVRHGEVTLAENTKNINANLSYSNLRAFTIDGKETTIVASYSPVAVQKWNYGQLQADYSDQVALEEVKNLRLIATSSDVTINRLVDKLYVKSKYGPLKINDIGKNFSDIDISLQNSELLCETPSTPFTIYVNGTSSKFDCPAELHLVRTKNHNTVVQKGYHISKANGGSIVINSKYSDVIFD